MRILMLGWEFPPHISGGLGTACQGLTEALSDHHVDLTFVVPQLYGDESQDWMQMRGAEDILQNSPPEQLVEWLDGAPTPLTAQLLSTSHHFRTMMVQRRYRVVEEGRQKTIRIDSALHPYLTMDSYLQQQQQGESYRRLEIENETQIIEGVMTQTRSEEPGPAPSPPKVARITQKKAAKYFSGRYGPNLMVEVGMYAFAVEQLAAKEDFDLIHAHDWMTYPAGLALAARSGKPLVVHLHASEYDRSGDHVNPEVRAIEAAGFAGADRVVCVSHFTANLLRQKYGVPPASLSVVHNAVKHKNRNKVDTRRKIQEPIVLFLGRVTHQKGPDYFLQAARKVIDAIGDVKFVMAGDGDMLRGIIERAAALGIGDNIHFTGFLRGLDVERMYAMADLYVMPSVSEPFGIAPLESIALDTPVIVSRQSGVSEVLPHALKCDFWDVDLLAAKIIAVLTHPELRNSLIEQGRNELRDMQWSIRAEHLIQVYQDVLAEVSP